MNISEEMALLLSRYGTYGDMFGRGMSLVGTLQAGKEASDLAGYQADQLRANASDAQAAGQRAAYNEDEKTKLVMSEALARAAASGGGASDPTVVSILAKTASEGAYRRAVALYSGDSRAQGMEQQADVAEYQGKNAKVNAGLSAGAQLYGAGTTLMKAAASESSMFSRFGMGNPGLMGNWGR